MAREIIDDNGKYLFPEFLLAKLIMKVLSQVYVCHLCHL